MAETKHKAVCEAIAAVAAAARIAGVVYVKVDTTAGPIELTLAPPAPAADHARLAPVIPVGPRRGPASRLAEFHEKQQKQRHDVLFAASSVKPAFTKPEPPPSTVPRAERDRRAARGEQENG
jgi:hypothetical protein